MKIMKIRIITAWLILLVSLASCEKKDDITLPTSRELLPSFIVYNYGTTTNTANAKRSVKTRRFEYDNQKRITKIHSTYINLGQVQDMIVTVALTYDKNKITATTTRTDWLEFISKTDFTLQGSEVYIDAVPDRIGRNGIKLNASLQVVKYKSLSQGIGNYDIDYTYDSRGNATSVTWYPSPKEDHTQTYTLASDLSNGVFRNVKTPAWYLTTQLEIGDITYQNLINNCIKAMENSHTIYEYENTYNSANYPTIIKRNSTIDGSEIVDYTIEYIAAN